MTDIKLGPQPKPDDYRIFKGTPSEFFDKIAKEWEQRRSAKNGPTTEAIA